MIVEFLMGILAWVVGLLPEWSPLGLASSYVEDFFDIGIVSDAMAIFGWLNHYVPVDVAVTLLGYSLIALTIGWTYTGLMWVWRNLPGKAT